jgi:hypothetical protein
MYLTLNSNRQFHRVLRALLYQRDHRFLIPGVAIQLGF